MTWQIDENYWPGPTDFATRPQVGDTVLYAGRVVGRVIEVQYQWQHTEELSGFISVCHDNFDCRKVSRHTSPDLSHMHSTFGLSDGQLGVLAG